MRHQTNLEIDFLGTYLELFSCRHIPDTISQLADFILTVLTPLGLRLLPPIFAATGLLVIAASGPGFGLEHTVYMNFVEITKENEIIISPDWGNCFGP